MLKKIVLFPLRVMKSRSVSSPWGAELPTSSGLLPRSNLSRQFLRRLTSLIRMIICIKFLRSPSCNNFSFPKITKVNDFKKFNTLLGCCVVLCFLVCSRYTCRKSFHTGLKMDLIPGSPVHEVWRRFKHLPYPLTFMVCLFYWFDEV